MRRVCSPGEEVSDWRAMLPQSADGRMAELRERRDREEDRMAEWRERMAERRGQSEDVSG